MSLESICLAQHLMLVEEALIGPLPFKSRCPRWVQRRNTSLRAHIVRIAPESGLKSDIARGPKSAQRTNPLTREGLAAQSSDYVCRSNYLNERK